MKKLSKSEKILLTICMALLFIYVYYSFIWTPLSKKITVFHEQIGRDNIAVNNINLTKLQNKKRNEELQSLQTKYEDASNALPKSEKTPEITYEIKKLADNNETVINSIVIGKNTDYKNQTTTDNKNNVKNDRLNNGTGGKLMFTPVTLNVTGSYLKILDFVSAIEADKRIVEANTLNISTDSNGVTTATININYYYLASN